MLERLFGKRRRGGETAVTRPDGTNAKTLDEVNARLDGLAVRARDEQERWGGYYQDGRDYVFDNQLADIHSKEGWERPQHNAIWPAITQEQALLAQRRQIIVAEPWERSDAEGAKLRRNLLQWLYLKELDVPMLSLRWTIDAKTHGHWVVRTWWDDRAEWDAAKMDWKGAIRAKLMRPERVSFDPKTTPYARERSRWVHAWLEVPLQDALARWPDHEEAIRGAIGPRPPNEPGSAVQSLFGTPMPDKPERPVVPAAGEGRLARLLDPSVVEDAEPDDGFETVWIEEFFFEDPATVSEDVVVRERSPDEMLTEGLIEMRPGPLGALLYHNTETGEEISNEEFLEMQRETRRVDRPLYPHGRHVLRVGAKTILLNEAWPHRRWAYVQGWNLLLPHTWHGLNGVEMAKGLQDWTNICLAHMLNYVKNFGDPNYKVEEGALQNCPDNRNAEEKIRSRAGSVIKCSVGRINGVQREPAPPVSDGLLRIADYIERNLRDKTGVQEIALGRQTTGDTTATEALRLETNTKLRTALQGLLQEYFTIELMTAVDELAGSHMTAGEVVRIVGEPEPAAPGAPPPFQPATATLTQKALDSRYDLRLTTTSDLPYDQQREQGKWAQLLQMLGPLTTVIRALLQAYGVENVEKIIQELQQQQQGAAQAAAAEKQVVDEQRYMDMAERAQRMAVEAQPQKQEQPGGGRT